jgi:uncharacterized RDD family membrane protein YckC
MTDDQNRKPLPWEDAATPPPDPSDPTIAWTGESPVPTTPEPPITPPAAPDPVLPATPGLISAAPVGWTGQDIGGPPAMTPGVGTPIAAASQPPGSPPPAAPWGQPTVGWEPPREHGREVPGAPGLVFADTVPRFVAYVVDSILISIAASIIAGALGFGTISIRESASGFTSWNYGATGAALVVAGAILSLLYFVVSWTGGRRATIGQRIFHLQVGNAVDGRGLTLEQAVRRWFGLGSAIGLLALLPRMESPSNLIALLWSLALLFTTVTSPTKQGLHDRFANTWVVRPAGQSSSGLATACLVIVLVLGLLAVVSIVALIFLGSQMSDILEEIGRSV